MDKRYVDKSRRQKQLFTYVFQNRCSKKFRKFHRKIFVLDFLFYKVADPKA